MITNAQTNTTIDEIGDQIYRISIPVQLPDGSGFSFNQYLLVDEEPLLFHTGLRSTFPLTAEAIAAVMPVEKLRWISFSHFEADECGALNLFLNAAPEALPLCSRVAAMVSVGDMADRAPRALGDGETITTGRRTLRWVDAPHVPHNWETGFLIDESSRTLFCGDLFSHGGATNPALTEDDLIGPSEAFRLGGIQGGMYDSYSSQAGTRPIYERLAALEPVALACMHGSAWRGRGEDASKMILTLADCLGATTA